MTHEAQRSEESAAEMDIDAVSETMTSTKETLEDYTLRFAPRSYRKWSTAVVGISALGGIAYLADFAIGANIGMAYGTTNALWGILIFAVVIFPLVIYGMKVLSKLQVWTTPLWLFLMVFPFAYLVISHPESVGQFFAYQG